MKNYIGIFIVLLLSVNLYCQVKNRQNDIPIVIQQPNTDHIDSLSTYLLRINRLGYLDSFFNVTNSVENILKKYKPYLKNDTVFNYVDLSNRSIKVNLNYAYSNATIATIYDDSMKKELCINHNGFTTSKNNTYVFVGFRILTNTKNKYHTYEGFNSNFDLIEKYFFTPNNMLDSGFILIKGHLSYKLINGQEFICYKGDSIAKNPYNLDKSKQINRLLDLNNKAELAYFKIYGKNFYTIINQFNLNIPSNSSLDILKKQWKEEEWLREYFEKHEKDG